jgi:transketolase
VPGIEASTGSLGHGLSIAAGMALAAKKDNKKFRVFCLLSDGECDEGSIWEAAIFSASHSLDNLIAIIDYNKLQAMGKTEDIFKLEPFYDKWRAFGWSVREVDGHNIKQLEDALKNVPFDKDKPSCVIAHTIKGKGVSFMENNILWHYRTPDDFEFKKAINELKDKY